MAERLSSFLYVIPGVIIALSFHEWGHAYAAFKMGDPTARNLGRMTLNPLAHIDPIGFLMMVVVGFGWAKPVPVNSNNYKSYKKGELVVSLAGVTMNLILAIVGAFLLSLFFKLGFSGRIELNRPAAITANLLNNFVFLNLCLMLFNLLPIFPLDGFHVAEVLLSKYVGHKPFAFLKQYGQYILIAVLVLGYFSGTSLMGDAADWLRSALLNCFNSLFGI